MNKLLALTLLAASAGAHATTDAAGDFLASFTGTPVAALDIRAADVSFDAAANSFVLHAMLDGPVAGAAGAAYVFGFDRGGAVNQPFSAIGFPDVRFNATVTLRADGTGTVGSTPVVTAIAGNHIFGVVSASLLPSNGLLPANYSWALWAIDSRISGAPRNADFAGFGNFAVATAVPEPQTLALMLAGITVLGGLARRRGAR